MPFSGLRVVSLESRRSAEIEQLIRNQHGTPFVAPSMREVPDSENAHLFDFAERLFRGDFDMGIFMTGVGTRALHKILATRYGAERFPEALRSITVVARGPKPVGVLRELKVPIDITVPEPNTTREILAAVEGRPEKRIFVQEYGEPNLELIAGLRARGAEATPVHVYSWDLPEDTAPLREAVRRLTEGKADVVLLTASAQIDHLFRIASEMGMADALREGMKRLVVASIGPVNSATLREYGIEPDIEPTHPKMGLLVKETAEQSAAILKRKQNHETNE